MPRRHTLTNAELTMIQEGLSRLSRETATALQSAHLTTDGKAQLRVHAIAIACKYDDYWQEKAETGYRRELFDLRHAITPHPGDQP